MKTLLHLLFALTISSLVAQSNNGNISFSEYEHKFGYINEVDGEVEHTFYFTNKSKKPFTIIEVISECGCTAPSYTKKDILPGDTGRVKVVFNPESPIDKEFNKTLTVRVTNDTALLKIRGIIIPIERPKEEAMFIKKMGNTWFRSAYFQFGKMTNNKTYTKTFDYYNGGTDSLTLNTDEIPDFLKIKILPKIIAPKTVGTIEIQYDAKLKHDYGYLNEPINLVSTEDTLQLKKMFISGNIAEYFPATIDLKKAPKAVVTSPKEANIGAVAQFTPKEALFTLKNEGKKKLIIRKINSSCSCIQVEMPTTMEIKSGEEITIKAIFDGSARRKGNVLKSFYIYVNDPTNPILRFKIKATVK